MAKESLTNRSKKELEKRGLTVAIVEYRIPHSFITKDLYGFGDILAFGEGQFVIVQTTSRANMAARRKKIAGIEAAAKWVQNGGKILLHGWDKPERFWRLKEEQITCDTLGVALLSGESFL